MEDNFTEHEPPWLQLEDISDQAWYASQVLPSRVFRRRMESLVPTIGTPA